MSDHPSPSRGRLQGEGETVSREAGLGQVLRKSSRPVRPSPRGELKLGPFSAVSVEKASENVLPDILHSRA